MQKIKWGRFEINFQIKRQEATHMINIAMDGPACSGKTSVADKLAELMGIYHLNTGALYRAIAMYLLENKVDIEKEQEVKKAVKWLTLGVDFIDKEQITTINNKSVIGKIYDIKVSHAAAKISPIREVRDLCVKAQREAAKKYNIVVEGRDITSVVLPTAKYKFFITASLTTRAARNLEKLLATNKGVTFDEALNDIVERDSADMTRKISPLKLTKDSIYIDTDKYTIDEVVAIIYGYVKREAK